MNRFCMNLIKAFSVSLGIYSTSSYAISNINVYYYNGNDNFINLYATFLGKLSERSSLNFKFHDAQNHAKEQVESIITGLYSGSPAIVNLVDVNDADKIMENCMGLFGRVAKSDLNYCEFGTFETDKEAYNAIRTKLAAFRVVIEKHVNMNGVLNIVDEFA